MITGKAVAIVSANALLATAALSSVIFIPPADQPVRVVPLPWADTDDALADVVMASGYVLEVDERGVTAISNDPDFLFNLYGRGNVAVIAATAVKGCFRRTENDLAST